MKSELFDQIVSKIKTYKSNSNVIHDAVLLYSNGTTMFSLAEDNREFKYTGSSDYGLTNFNILLTSLNSYLKWNAVGSLHVVFVAMGNDTINGMEAIIQSLQSLYADAQGHVLSFNVIGVGTHDVFLMEKLRHVATADYTYECIDDDALLETLDNAVERVKKSVPLTVRATVGTVTTRVPMIPVGSYALGFLFGETEGLSLEINTKRGKKTITLTMDGEAPPAEYLKLILLYLRINGSLTYISNRLDETGIASMTKSLNAAHGVLTGVKNSLLSLGAVRRKQIMQPLMQLGTMYLMFRQRLSDVSQKRMQAQQYAYLLKSVACFDVGLMFQNSDLVLLGIGNNNDVVIDGRSIRKLEEGGDALVLSVLDGKIVYDTAESIIVATAFDGATESKYNTVVCVLDWNVELGKTKELYDDLSIAYTNALRLLHFIICALFEKESSDKRVIIEQYKLCLATCIKLQKEVGCGVSQRDLVEFVHPGCTKRVTIKDLEMFAAEVFVGISAATLPRFQSTESAKTFFMVLREEQLRRSIGRKYSTMPIREVRDFVRNVIGLDTKYSEGHIARYEFLRINEFGKENAKMSNEDRFAMRLTEGSKLANIDLTSARLYIDLPSIDRDTEEKAIFRMLDHSLKCDDIEFFNDSPANYVTAYSQLVAGVSLDRIESKDAILSICMFLQNLMQRSNEMRSEALRESGIDKTMIISGDEVRDNYMVNIRDHEKQYVDFCGPCGYTRVIEWLRGLYRETNKRLITEGFAKIDESLSISHDDLPLRTRARLFVHAETINSAITYLYGMKIGSAGGFLIDALTECGSCSDCLCEDTSGKFRCTDRGSTVVVKAPLIAEKMQMLINGSWKGIRLLHDRNRNGRSEVCQQWKISDRNMRTIRRRHCLLT